MSLALLLQHFYFEYFNLQRKLVFKVCVHVVGPALKTFRIQLNKARIPFEQM